MDPLMDEMEIETQVIKLKDYAMESIPDAGNGVRDWCDNEDISHEADTETFETPTCSPDDNSCATTASTVSEPMNDSTKPFEFELSENDVADHLKKSVEEEEYQLPLPNEVAYTEKEKPMDEEIHSSDCEKKDSSQSSEIIYFVNHDAKISPSPVLQYVLDTNQPFDTVISCADGKIGAHRLVLASASPFIGDMFCSHDHRLGEVAMLVLPDVRMQIMKALLQFCYTGSMFFPKENEEEIVETMKLLLLGEFANLSMKEVTVKLPPPEAIIPVANSRIRQSGLEPQPSTSSSVGGGAETSESLDSLEDLLSSSEDDEADENGTKDSSSEEEYEDDQNKKPAHRKVAEVIQDEELERLELANTYLKYKKNEDATINYIIPPRAPGVKTKTKKLLCYHCPGTFKSMDTLTTHLENSHGVDLESRNLNISEFKTLTDCGYCSTEHDGIASTNSCISGHAKTRCYICFEVVRNKDFADHVKTLHATDKRNGMCIVSCRWCDAGLLLQDPIDNKPMSGHCFANHFPGGRSTKITMMDIEKESMKKDSSKSAKIQPPNSVSNTSTHDFKLPRAKSTSCTPLTNTPDSKMTNKNVPPVLALLQKASLKRKLVQETESDSNEQAHDNLLNNVNPTKRARLDANGKRLQVARRTGKPVGRLVDFERLKNGIPAMKTTAKSRGMKVKMVSLDVTKLPSIYVNITYPKTFVWSSFNNDKENRSPTVNSINDSDCLMTISSTEKEVAQLNTTEEAKTPETKRRHSDSRCSLPCL